jgi:hypothetical protein
MLPAAIGSPRSNITRRVDGSSRYWNEMLASGGPLASSWATSANSPTEAVTSTVTEMGIATPVNSETARSGASRAGILPGATVAQSI